MWHHAPYFLPQSECSVLIHRVNWKCLSELWRCALTVRCWTRTVCTLALFFSKAFLFYLIFFAVSRPSAVSLSSALVLLPFVLWDGNLSMLNPSHSAMRFQVGRFWTISPSRAAPRQHSANIQMVLYSDLGAQTFRSRAANIQIKGSKY